jgi:tetratricopeptide (TPR) repeat protein
VEEAARRGQDACRAGLLVESGTGYRFANDLVRDVIYETTPAPVRAIRHRRLAAVLAADRPEAAAGHAAASDDWHGAVVGWLAAAERATAAFANREALDLLTHALDACALLDEPRLTGEVQLARGRAQLALGDYGGAARDLTVAQQMGRAVGDGTIEAVALTELGWAAYHERQRKRAHDLAERAAAHPQAGPRAAILVARIRNTDGDLATASRLLEPLASETDPASRALALSCLATVQAHAGRFPEARRTAERAVAACLRTGVLRGLLNARMFVSLTCANLGDFGGALEAGQALLADVARYDASYYRSRALNALAWAWRELGEPERSAELAAEALELSTGPRLEGEPAANALLGLAESALLAGDEGEAARRLGDLAPLQVESVGFGWRIDLLRLELLTRMDGGAGADAEELLARARRHEATKYVALGLAALGRVDDAVAAAQRTGSPVLVARVAPGPLARAQVEAIAAGLPPELRDRFVRRGPLAARLG